MKNIKQLLLITMTFLTSVSILAQDNGSDEGKRIDEIIKGERTNCTTAPDQGMTPTLLFETLSPKVTVNETASLLTIQMKIIYYRYLKNTPNGSAQFTVTNPNLPYQYNVEQLDGSSSTIKVNNQSHRFNIKLKSAKLEPGYPQQIGSSGNVHLIQLNIPIKKLLTPSQEIKLRNGSELDISIPVMSEISTDYAINSQTKDKTNFTPGTLFNWNITLSMKGKNSIKAELKSIK
jgi:hypothetical protein